MLAAPTFFPHYLGAVAVPGTMVFGGVVDRVQRWSAIPDVKRIGLVIAGGIVLVLDLVGLAVIRSGDSVPAAKLATVVEPAAGCITADDPNVLLAMGVVGRNAQRECELVIDLGGYSHDLSRGTAIARRRNGEWQQFVVRYLGSGQFALVPDSARTTASAPRQPRKYRVGRSLSKRAATPCAGPRANWCRPRPTATPSRGSQSARAATRRPVSRCGVIWMNRFRMPEAQGTTPSTVHSRISSLGSATAWARPWTTTLQP